jgi:hypothetical protein
MGKYLHVLFLLALASSSFSVFQKPWDDQAWVSSNPHISVFGIELWWDLPVLHQTIGSIDTGRAESVSLPSPVAKNVEDASKASADAANKKDLCILSLIGTLGAMPLSPSAPFTMAFSEASGCMAYEDSWKSAVGSSLIAADAATTSSGKSVADARSAYDRLVFMGICEGSYTGSGSEVCPELRSAFSAVDRNITEGRYGIYPLLLSYRDELKAGLWEPVPDLSRWAPMLELAFGDDGVIETFDGARAKADSAARTAEDAFKLLGQSAASKRSLAEGKLESLETQKLYLIDKAPSGYDARSAGSVDEKMALIMQEKGGIDASVDEAETLRQKTWQKGYLAAALEIITHADSGYQGIQESAESLSQEAEEAVEQERETASAEISSAEKALSGSPGDSQAIEALDEARALFEKGESARTLGERFSFYSKAAAMARIAGSGGTMQEEALSGASRLLLEDLVKRAERDGLDVSEEKKLLSLSSSLPPSEAEGVMQSAIDAIIMKARARYESDILSSRKRIYDKVDLAGPDAADLRTDLSNLEDGLFSDESIAFPDAVGSLSALGSGYASIEKEVDNYMRSIVGNAMSARAMPLIGPVRLDEQSDIRLDIVLTNPRPYSGTSVSVSVATSPGMGFLYSDIKSGKDGVSSIRDGPDGLIIVFSQVAPYETKRVILEKSMVVARTIKKTVAAIGIGDGKAVVKEQVDFELDIQAPSLELPEGCEDALIDGAQSQRILEIGKHSISCERVVDGAYADSVANFRAFSLGAMSRVEFDIRIIPEIDLDRASIFIDSLNDSSISKFSLVSVTGEPVKEQSRLSDTQYSATLSGLKAGRTAVVRISYTVDDTASYVEKQLSLLRGGNMSADARSLLDQAAFQSGAGNSTRALELVSQAISKMHEDEKAASSLQGKKEALVAKIRQEIADIEAALSYTGSNSTLTSRLSSRKGELDSVLEDVDGKDIEEGIAALEKVDVKWLDNEISAFRKDAYKSYNDLKERFYKAGNASTPKEFLAFEEALQKLDTMGKPEYAVTASIALGDVERVVKGQESVLASQNAALKSIFDSVKRDSTAVLEWYLKEASAAKGTAYSSYFTETNTKVDRLMKDAEASLKVDQRAALASIADLNASRAKMELTLGSLGEESEAKASALAVILAKKTIDQSQKTILEGKLEGIRKLIAAGELVNALRASDSLSEELDSGASAAPDGFLILGLTAFAILSAAGFYLHKQQKPKELKKLSSWSDQPWKKSGPGAEKKMPEKGPQPKAAEPAKPQERASGQSGVEGASKELLP